MEAIHVRQRLRPIRYAFMINEGDMEAALAAVSCNTVLWGGIYNPIVPFTPEPEREGLLAEFDPDEIVDLTSGSLDKAFLDRYLFHVVTPEYFVDRDRGGRRLAFGFDILPILRQIHEKEVRYSTDPTRAALVGTTVDGWLEYVSFVFGSFSRLPHLEIDFLDVFRRALRARDVVFDPTNIPNELAEIVSPIQATGYGLRVFTPPAAISSHILYIGNHRNCADLIEFWNLRATGRTVLFVPMDTYERYGALIRAAAAEGRNPINPEPELQRAPSLREEVFDRVCDWVGTLNIGRFQRRDRRPRFGYEADYYVGDIHACELEAKSGEEISILTESRMTPVKLISPDQLDEERTLMGDYRWATDITMSGSLYTNDYTFTFPYEPAVEKVVHQGIIGGPRSVRLGRRTVVTFQDYPRDVLYLIPVQTQAVFAALFEEVGLDMEPSQPGRYAAEIIKKMGGRLHFDCRIFKLQGVRAVIDKLSHGDILTKGNIHDIVTSKDHWRPDFYENIFIRQGQRGKLNFTRIFDFLLEKRVVRPGFTMRCRTCYGEDWYHVSEFDEEYTCRFCFSSQRVNFASARDWQYKADGLFQIRDSALGSLAVIVSLWRIEHLHSLKGGRYHSSANLRDPKTGWACEVDYAYLMVGRFNYPYDLVLGQAAKSGDFTEQDIANMSVLADRFGKRPWLAFSTLRETLSDNDKRLLNDLADRGYRVIALTRLELDPYDLHNRFSGAPHQYAVSLRHLSDNTRHLNLR